MKKTLFAALLCTAAFATPAHAQNAGALCTLMATHKSPAAYTPGVDVNGKPVASADISAPLNTGMSVVHIPMTVDLAQSYSGHLPAGTKLEGGVGVIEIHQDGKVIYNGQDITAASVAVCSGAPSAAPAATAPEAVSEQQEAVIERQRKAAEASAERDRKRAAAAKARAAEQPAAAPAPGADMPATPAEPVAAESVAPPADMPPPMMDPAVAAPAEPAAPVDPVAPPPADPAMVAPADPAMAAPAPADIPPMIDPAMAPPPAAAPAPEIDPVTGLPVSSAPAPEIDPVTGLPVSPVPAPADPNQPPAQLDDPGVISGQGQ